MPAVSRLMVAALAAAAVGTVAPTAIGVRGPAAPRFGLRALDARSGAPLGRSWFVFRARPGRVVTGAVRVTNDGRAPGTVLLYPVDATTGRTSGAVYLTNSRAPSGDGRWIRLARRSLRLAPGQSQVVAFSVRAPAGATAGQHLAGLAAENATPGKLQASGSVRIRIRAVAILAVQLNLPGAARASLASTGISTEGASGRQAIVLGLQNTGNVMLKPWGDLRVTDGQGHLVQARPIRMDTFLPGTAIDYPVPVGGRALGAGSYTADLRLHYGPPAGALERVMTFDVTPLAAKQVFEPPAALQPPTSPQGSGSRSLLGWALGGIGLALVLLAGWKAGLLRRWRR